MNLGPHTITRQRGTEAPSDYGTGTSTDWSSPDELTIPGCSVQPVAAEEFNNDRNSTAVRWQAWVPADADVASTDRVLWNGNTYDVDGEPQAWGFPPLDHQVVLLRRSQEDST